MELGSAAGGESVGRTVYLPDPPVKQEWVDRKYKGILIPKRIGKNRIITISNVMYIFNVRVCRQVNLSERYPGIRPAKGTLNLIPVL